MTLISEEQYRAFLHLCGKQSLYYEESLETPRPLADVAGWLDQHPDDLRRFLERYPGDRDDVLAMQAELEWIQSPSGKNARACAIMNAWIDRQWQRKP